MHAKTHARWMALFNLATLVVGISLFCRFVFASTSGNIAPVLVFIAVCFVLWLVLWGLPVRCTTPGCNGRMHKTMTELPPFEARLRYRCAICNDLYEANIFQMSSSGDYYP